MTSNDILKAEREGKLGDYSLEQLREMRRVCAHSIQSGNKSTLHAKESVDKEIHRKEMESTEQRGDAAVRRMHDEALAQSRRSTLYARRSFVTAIFAVAISLGAWIFPRVIHESPPQDGAHWPARLPLQRTSAPPVGVVATNVSTPNTPAFTTPQP